MYTMDWMVQDGPSEKECNCGCKTRVARRMTRKDVCRQGCILGRGEESSKPGCCSSGCGLQWKVGCKADNVVEGERESLPGDTRGRYG